MKSTIFLLCIALIFSLGAEFIKYQEEDNIAILTISRPKALNALNSKVLEELNNALENIDQDKIRVLIITGEGEKSFVAGADIAEMSTLSKKRRRSFLKKRK